MQFLMNKIVEEHFPHRETVLLRFNKRGIRLLHLKTDVEQISNQTTIAKLREKES